MSHAHEHANIHFACVKRADAHKLASIPQFLYTNTEKKKRHFIFEENNLINHYIDVTNLGTLGNFQEN